MYNSKKGLSNIKTRSLQNSSILIYSFFIYLLFCNKIYCIPLQESGGIRVGTIGKFQGQEDEVTIISMVRSNKKMYYQEAIGFVNIPRSCVAFSRSKRKTIIVGDCATLLKSKFLAQSIDTITKKDGFFVWRDSIA